MCLHVAPVVHIFCDHASVVNDAEECGNVTVGVFCRSYGFSTSEKALKCSINLLYKLPVKRKLILLIRSLSESPNGGLCSLFVKFRVSKEQFKFHLICIGSTVVKHDDC